MNKTFVLFDPDCKLCSNAVRFITKNDSRKRFCFIPLGSERANDFLRLYNGKVAEKGTMMLITGRKIYLKSDAVLRILKFLDSPWPLLYVFLIIPRFIRDPIYDLVAKYRYRWFGPCTDCPDFRPC